MTSAKAIVAGIAATLLAGIAALSTILVGDLTLNEITQAQWLTVIGSMVTTGASVFGLTWSVTNKPAAPVVPPGA